MNEFNNILICGERGAGKSTLIKKLLKVNTRPVYGFMTKRKEPDQTGFHPIYIYPAGSAELSCGEDNLIGTCDSVTHNVNIDKFNTLGVEYLSDFDKNGIIIMDELGFMEAEAADFTSAVFKALNSSTPVIAAVKSRYDVDFLNKVRASENSKIYEINEENREDIYRELKGIITEWNSLN